MTKNLRRRQRYNLIKEYINPTLTTSRSGGINLGVSLKKKRGKGGANWRRDTTYTGGGAGTFTGARGGGGFNVRDIVSTAPAAISTAITGVMPRITSTMSGKTVNRREFVSDINGSTAPYSAGVHLYGLPITPHDHVLFPWLSVESKNWESYQFVYLNFVYEPRCPTTTTGHISMAIQYDPAAATPQSIDELLLNQTSATGTPWSRLSMRADVGQMNKFTRHRFLKGWHEADDDSNKQNSAAGKIFFAEGSQADNTTIGQLYVEYAVNINTPKKSANPSESFALGTSDGTGASAIVVFGTTFAFQADSPMLQIINEVEVNAAGDTLTFNRSFVGVVNIYATGSGLGAIGDNGSTATVEQVLGHGTTAHMTSIWKVRASAGQTYKPSFATWTTCTNLRVVLTPWHTSNTF